MHIRHLRVTQTKGGFAPAKIQLHTLRRDGHGPEEAACGHPRVMIMELKFKFRKGVTHLVNVHSIKAERPAVLSPINTDILTLHKPHIGSIG